MSAARVDAAVVGGGAAGLSAAVFLCRAAAARGKAPRLAVLEQAPRVGRRLLATGNGTCNITNRHADTPRQYHGGDPAFAGAALAAFAPAAAMDFFAGIGVPCVVRPDGRAYPLCEQAAAVLDCLRLELAAAGVEERCEARVDGIRRERDGFVLTLGDERLYARQVLVAAGGAAAPSLGGGTGGYALLSALGHRRTPLFPAIVPLCADSPWLRAVKGLRVDAALTLRHNDRPLTAAAGELLFTEYGLSGPAALALSRAVGDWERTRLGAMTVTVDLLPAWSEDEVAAEIARRRALPGRTLADLLTGLLHKRVGQTVLRAVDAAPLTRPAASLSEAEGRRAARCVKNWRFSLTGTRGLAAAQVTAGGMETALFDPKTMRSRRVPGLYAAGEVLDIDGDCGGFNLQWAWSSAHAAAEAMAEEM